LAEAYREAETSEGFIARASGRDYERSPFDQSFGPFGAFRAPRFYQRDKFGDNSVGQTLSLWTGIGAAHGFAYGGLHKDALAQRSKWFLKPEWPTYVMWWVADEHVPNWQEASLRLEYIHDKGPTPHAFNFGTAFNVEGRRLQGDNAARQPATNPTPQKYFGADGPIERTGPVL